MPEPMSEEFKHMERIERYFEGRMEEEEARDFEIALMVDPELKQESDLYKSTVLAMKDLKAENIRHRLKDLEKELDLQNNGPGRRSTFPMQRFLLAALLVLAIGSTLFLLKTGPARSSIGPDILPFEEGLPVLMGTSGVKAFDDAMSLFKAGEYDEAYKGFRPLLDLQPGNDTLLYYTGNALIRSGRAVDALPLFQRLTESNSPTYSLKAGVYLALCSWETGAKQDAINQLREISFLEKHPLRNEAKVLLKFLESSQ